MTLDSWMRQMMCTRAGRALMSLAITAVFSAEPGDLSLLHFLFYNRSGGFSRGLMKAQQWRFVGGSQEVAIRSAAQITGSVRLGAAVRSLGCQDGGVTVTADGVEARGRRVVITVPPALAGRIVCRPDLPADRDRLTQSAPMGSVIKSWPSTTARSGVMPA